jgi:hypothetical protein
METNGINFLTSSFVIYIGKHHHHHQSGDYVKAEPLGREAYRIHVQLYGEGHYYIGFDSSVLTNILVGQGKLGDETKQLYERYLAICRRNEGPDGINTAIGNYQLGNFHLKVGTKYKMDSIQRNEQLRLARPYVIS